MQSPTSFSARLFQSKKQANNAPYINPPSEVNNNHSKASTSPSPAIDAPLIETQSGPALTSRNLSDIKDFRNARLNISGASVSPPQSNAFLAQGEVFTHSNSKEVDEKGIAARENTGLENKAKTEDSKPYDSVIGLSQSSDGISQSKQLSSAHEASFSASSASPRLDYPSEAPQRNSSACAIDPIPLLGDKLNTRTRSVPDIPAQKRSGSASEKELQERLRPESKVQPQEELVPNSKNELQEEVMHSINDQEGEDQKLSLDNEVRDDPKSEPDSERLGSPKPNLDDEEQEEQEETKLNLDDDHETGVHEEAQNTLGNGVQPEMKLETENRAKEESPFIQESYVPALPVSRSQTEKQDVNSLSYSATTVPTCKSPAAQNLLALDSQANMPGKTIEPKMPLDAIKASSREVEVPAKSQEGSIHNTSDNIAQTATATSDPPQQSSCNSSNVLGTGKAAGKEKKISFANKIRRFLLGKKFLEMLLGRKLAKVVYSQFQDGGKAEESIQTSEPEELIPKPPLTQDESR